MMTIKRFAILSIVAMLAVSLTACQSKKKTPADANSSANAVPEKPAGSVEPGSGAIKMDLTKAPVKTTALSAEEAGKAQALLNKGLDYILSQRQEDGGWSFGNGALEPALTGLVLRCLLAHPDFDRNSPVVKKAFQVMLSYRQPDGAIFNPKEGRPAYTTSIAIMAMVAADDPQYKGVIQNAVNYLEGIQVQPGQESPDGTTITANDPNVGGVGYGSNNTSNLSVTGFAIEAWHDANVPTDSKAMKSAIGFLTRLQNRSESNPMKFAKDGPNDGGFVYDTTSSKAGAAPGGGMRSYGSMTYAGFKSMLYAGVSRDDPRVQAAYEWIRRYWRLDTNPNMPAAQSKQGLFYYYMVYAKALRAFGRDEIQDIKQADVKHNWRAELVNKLGELAQPDGSWLNEADRWNEGSPTLVTCYAVLALEQVLQK